MHTPTSSAQPTPPRRHGFAVPCSLAILSTAIAFASHAMFGAPGDHPIPLLALGCLLAFAAGAVRNATLLATGLASLAGFPIEAAVDIVLHGGHNLLPFEFAIYAVYGLLGVLAARFGRGTVGRVVT